MVDHNQEHNCQLQRLCPIHNCALEKYETGVLNGWYCHQCKCYYVECIQHEPSGRITISGKPVKFLSDRLPQGGKSSTTPPDPQNRKDWLAYVQACLGELPLSSEIQFCPIHECQLDVRKGTVNGKSGWSRELSLGLCKKCRRLYSNDSDVVIYSPVSIFGVPVAWNPKQFEKFQGRKNQKRVFQNQTIYFHNEPVYIVRGKESASNDVLATAYNLVTLPDGFEIKIMGSYSLQHQGFVCTPTEYYAAVSTVDDLFVLRIDPLSLINKMKKRRSLKHDEELKQRHDEYRAQITKKQRAEDRRKNLKRAALPYLCYTLPLLKGKVTQCPFCDGVLLTDRVLRIAVYQDLKVSNVVLKHGLFCPHCETPFIDRALEEQLLLKLKPKMIYVFDARACKTPQELLIRAQEKVLVRNPKQQLAERGTAPTKENTMKNETETPPNLSYAPNTKVLVYAERCHCTACERKYGKDTIQNRTALVETISHHTAQVTVQYCVGCGKYYMNMTTFQQYCKKYGGILLECIMEPELCRQNASWLNFRPDTILSRCGYSVREGIPEQHRQAVLAYILDSGRASKHEILELISGFIRIRQTRMPEACKRWRDDMLYVSQYQIQLQPQVKGLTFKQAR